MQSQLRISVLSFNWRKLVFSHGWVYLEPFQWDDSKEMLLRPFRLASGENVSVAICARNKDSKSLITFSVASEACLSAADRAELRKQFKRSLRLTEDFSQFHQLCEDDPVLWFVSKYRCGGLLRGASAFEDVVKTVCTTNCDWRNTKRMCERLCVIGGGNFPTPEQILALPEHRLAKRTSAGYRARTFREIARLTADGKFDLDSLAAEGDFEKAKAILKPIWGIGPYALSHILVLLGDYSTIPVDCEILRYLRSVHFGSCAVSEREAVRPYEKYGEYRYLAFKFGRMSRRDNYINK